VLFASLSAAAIACGHGSSSTTAPSAPTSPTPSGSLFNGIAVTATPDPTFPAVAANPNHERLGVVAQNSRIVGGTFIAPDGTSATVFTGVDGLPARGVFGGTTVFYSNYTANTVDVTVVSANGASTTRGVAVDPAMLALLRTSVQKNTGLFLFGTRGPAAFTAADANLTLKIIGTAVSIGACAASTASVVLAAGACLSAVVKVLTLIDPNLDSPGLTASGLLMSSATCFLGAGSDWGCVSTIITALRLAEGQAESLLSSLAPPAASPNPSTGRLVVSASSLYLSDFSSAGTDRLLVTIALANRTPVIATDIAVTPDGRTYVVSFTNLYALNTGTGLATPIGSDTLQGRTR